jgi:hypothetical protein
MLERRRGEAEARRVGGNQRVGVGHGGPLRVIKRTMLHEPTQIDYAFDCAIANNARLLSKNGDGSLALPYSHVFSATTY